MQAANLKKNNSVIVMSPNNKILNKPTGNSKTNVKLVRDHQSW